MVVAAEAESAGTASYPCRSFLDAARVSENADGVGRGFALGELRGQRGTRVESLEYRIIM
eukprot:SAG22_NODE_2565_length_2435_cov_1.671233_1_plen_60_part_00